MSAFRYATVWCDESPNSPLMQCGEQVHGDTASEARREGKRLGWTRDGVRDYCPAHRRKPEPRISGTEDP